MMILTYLGMMTKCRSFENDSVTLNFRRSYLQCSFHAVYYESGLERYTTNLFVKNYVLINYANDIREKEAHCKPVFFQFIDAAL